MVIDDLGQEANSRQIELRDHNSLRHGSYGKNEMPSCFLLPQNGEEGPDPHTVKIGKEAFGHVGVHSVKYLFYCLDQAHSNDSNANYEPVRGLQQRLRHVDTQDFAITVIRRFLKGLWLECQEQGVLKNAARITMILTFPNTWSSKMTEWYETILRKAWEAAPIEEVCFIHESEAIAHCGFHHQSHTLARNQTSKIVFCDLGGHTMVSSALRYASGYLMGVRETNG